MLQCYCIACAIFNHLPWKRPSKRISSFILWWIVLKLPGYVPWAKMKRIYDFVLQLDKYQGFNAVPAKGVHNECEVLPSYIVFGGSVFSLALSQLAVQLSQRSTSIHAWKVRVGTGLEGAWRRSRVQSPSRPVPTVNFQACMLDLLRESCTVKWLNAKEKTDTPKTIKWREWLLKFLI